MDAVDPVFLEAIDANMEDWVEDVETLEDEHKRWVDVKVTNQETLVEHKFSTMDSCIDSTDERGTEDTRGTDGNDL